MAFFVKLWILLFMDKSFANCSAFLCVSFSLERTSEEIERVFFQQKPSPYLIKKTRLKFSMLTGKSFVSFYTYLHFVHEISDTTTWLRKPARGVIQALVTMIVTKKIVASCDACILKI